MFQAILGSLGSLVKGVAQPVANVMTAKEKTRQAKQAGITKLELAKEDGRIKEILTDAEWEAISAQSGENSWKDEYITVTATAWMWVGLIGCLAKAYDEPRILEGVEMWLKMCVANGVEIGILTTSVAFAAVGLKVWRGR